MEKERKIILELGCGPNKRDINSIGIDIVDYPGVDLVGDVFEILKRYDKNSVDEIYCSHFLEHIADLSILFDIIDNILKVDGLFIVTVPHFSNPYYYSDLSHVKQFGLYSFCYLTRNNFFKRSVPNYGSKYNWHILSVNLVFKSTPPFYIRHVLKKLFGYFFNLSIYTRELYEEIFCYIFPCYEVKFIVKKNG